MKGTFKIANISGIPLRVHWTFLLIFVWVVFVGIDNDGSFQITNLSNILISVLTLFTCVILHELGHAFAARRYGIRTQNIVLLPIGGVAMLERLPINPRHELIVAFAGPAVNFLIAIIFLPFLLLIDDRILAEMMNFILNINQGAFPPFRVSFFNWFVFFLVTLNVVVGIFNLIPAMPMDGGRVLRALLAIKLPRHKATQVAATIGAVLSGVITIYGVFQLNWILVFIGLYVFTSAFGEFRTIKNELFLAENKVSQLMDTNFSLINENTTLSNVLNAFSDQELNYLIVQSDSGNVVGILTQDSVLEAVKNVADHHRSIGSFFPFPAVKTKLDDSLQNALHTMYNSRRAALTVVEDDQVMGIIDRDTIHHFLK
jgi:Zn-dependent protease/predicted transcriptional regulator